MLTLPTQQPTQQELAALRVAALACFDIDFGTTAQRKRMVVESYEKHASPELILALLALIDAQKKKIAEQDAQLQAAYP